MKNKQENHHIVDVLFVLALFAVFAIAALMLVTIGANVYQKTVNNMDSNYSSRTAFSYVTEKLRQNDSAGTISIGTLEDRPALILSHEIDGRLYNTYLYQYEDYLTELFTSADLNLGGDILKAGHPLIPLQEFELEETAPALYHFYLSTEDGQTVSLYISTKSDTN